jgi:hypothetical protein
MVAKCIIRRSKRCGGVAMAFMARLVRLHLLQTPPDVFLLADKARLGRVDDAPMKLS